MEIFFCFLAVTAYGVIYGIPAKWLLAGAVVGVSAWQVRQLLVNLSEQPAYLATFLAALWVGIGSYTAARLLKTPATIFQLMGIIPLLPGAMAYSAMLAMVNGDMAEGLQLIGETVFVAGAIGGGLVFTIMLTQIKKQIHVSTK